MADPVSCAACIHFRRDEINPVQGLGWCALRKIVNYPVAPHYCRQREVEQEDAASE
jgi:hypothetical protein